MREHRPSWSHATPETSVTDPQMRRHTEGPPSDLHLDENAVAALWRPGLQGLSHRGRLVRKLLRPSSPGTMQPGQRPQQWRRWREELLAGIHISKWKLTNLLWIEHGVWFQEEAVMVLGSAWDRGQRRGRGLAEEVEARRAAFNLSVSQGYHNKGPKTGWLKTIGFYCFTVLEARSPKPRGQQAVFFLTALRDESPALLFLVSGVCWQPLGIPWPVDASLQCRDHVLPTCVHFIFPCGCLSLCPNFLVIGTPVRLEEDQLYDFILTWFPQILIPRC